MQTDTAPGFAPGRFLNQTVGFALRSARTLRRNAAVIFWAIGFPALFYLLTVYLFVDTAGLSAEAVGRLKATNAISYGGFAALVVFLNTFSQSLVADIEGGRYAQFRALPVSPSADFVGRFAAAFVLALAAVGAVLAVGAATGASYELRSMASIPVSLLGLLSLGLFAAGLAVLLVSVVPDAKFASIITISLVMLAFFLTGYNGVQPGMVAANAEFVNYVPNALATRLAVVHLVSVPDWTAAGLAAPAAPTGPGYVGLLVAYVGVGLATAVAVTRRSLYRGELR
ncbi:ABC transporter permease [Halovivax limisalsi]|uniref:ABC transporter permease n=1 Tax=Halovivax limisalsi TaxID=1453760 RepID=UPI001FFCE115|nr:ABC transporter permease [Halovivax limisalsi]